MNIGQYISSGVLEAYLLGELSPLENQEVESMISRYPEVKEELEKLEITLKILSDSASVTPSESVKNKLMEEMPGKTAKSTAQT